MLSVNIAIRFVSFVFNKERLKIMQSTKYMVEFEVAGKPYSSGPYTEDDIDEQFRDISSYEGVTNPRIVLVKD